MQTLRTRICEPPAVWSRTSLCILAALIAVLTGVASQEVSAQTSVLTDPSGDTDFNAPGFQDIIRAEVTKESDGFVVRMEVAAAVPANPTLPRPGVSEIWWVWALQFDPTSPQGYPIAPGETLPSEVHCHIGWNGTSFSAEVIDRRPLLNGGQPIIMTVPFSVQGSTLELHVPSAVVGNRSSFGWAALTWDWSGPVGTGGLHFVDLNTGHRSWP